MRLLNQSELLLASGGDDPLTLPPVVTTGTAVYPRPWEARGISLSEYLGLNASRDLLQYAQYQGGSGGGGIYDPSPDDGIYGINYSIDADGNVHWEAEVRGYFDVNGIEGMQAGEGPIEAGKSSVSTGGWGALENNISMLSTFTPLPNLPGV